jgi:long-chain fatty acid transport protein
MMPISNRRPLRRGFRRQICTSIFFLMASCGEMALGQTPRPPTPQFSFMQLRLVPAQPAARPASLGGAFIGIADDATAAAINPAGVSFLLRPEISLSQAFGQQTRDYPIGGEGGSVAQFRDRNPIFDQTLVNIAYPQWGFTFALYRQLAFHADFDFTRNQFLTFAPDRPLTLHEQLGASGNFPGLISNFSAQVIHNAFVAAKTVHRRLRLGFSVAATQCRLQLHESHFFDSDLWLQQNFTGAAIAIHDNRAESLYRLYDLELNEFKMTWTAGILVELDPALTLGLVYQHLPSFKAINHITLPAYSLPDRTPTDSQRDEINFAPEIKLVPFKLDLPDHYGVGLAWKPAGNTLMAFDAVVYRNHSLLRDLRLNLPQDDTLATDGSYVDPDGRNDIAAKDILSLHGGIEYRLKKSALILPLRAGFYLEPNFALHAVSPDKNLQIEYPNEAPRLHFTWGMGIIFKNARFEVSGDLSSNLIEGIGSAVFSF